jgi:hypothetical protein
LRRGGLVGFFSGGSFLFYRGVCLRKFDIIVEEIDFDPSEKKIEEFTRVDSQSGGSPEAATNFNLCIVGVKERCSWG